jgi:hypothetical protein
MTVTWFSFHLVHSSQEVIPLSGKVGESPTGVLEGDYPLGEKTIGGSRVGFIYSCTGLLDLPTAGFLWEINLHKYFN